MEKKLLTDMFNKRKTVLIHYNEAVEMLDGNETCVQYLINHGVIVHNPTSSELELDEAYQTFFENTLGTNEEINAATNRQPWKFLIITSEEAKAKIRQCYNREWFATAPMYILCMMAPNDCWVRKEDNKSHADIDLGIAIEHLCLAATDRGLGTCWVCNFEVETTKRLFPVESFEPVAIVPIGHIAPDCPHPEKSRKEMNEITEEI